jgi:hypothetical protein
MLSVTPFTFDNLWDSLSINHILVVIPIGKKLETDKHMEHFGNLIVLTSSNQLI